VLAEPLLCLPPPNLVTGPLELRRPSLRDANASSQFRQRQTFCLSNLTDYYRTLHGNLIRRLMQGRRGVRSGMECLYQILGLFDRVASFVRRVSELCLQSLAIPRVIGDIRLGH
jgi:hypothetical protein